MRRAFSSFSWATVDPEALSARNPAQVMNLVNGQWTGSERNFTLPDPLNGEEFIRVPDTTISELEPFTTSMRKVPKSGLHNPLKNVERYLLYGKVCERAAALLNQDDVLTYFSKLIQRVAPKSEVQSVGEMKVVRAFIENFSGDQVRFLARGFSVPGDHLGQQSNGYRWPYGPVAVIAPFNFPLEIPMLQTLGALFMGNKVLLKPEPKVALAAEQFLRFLHHCGMPLEDVDLLNSRGEAIEKMVRDGLFRNIQFTGSTKIADHITTLNKGRVKIEDSGFDWKVLGPDVADLEYVSYTSDQDAYAFGGQKCSAQSILFAHKNWVNAGLFEKLKELAERRSLDNLTIVPILTWNNKQIQAHVDEVLTIPGSRLLFGGRPLENSSIPSVYGSYYPTAVYVPLDQVLSNFELVTRELFGPFMIVTDWEDLDPVLEALERMEHHLTAGVVSKDPVFLQKVLANTVNGVTYAGIKARTTGAPQNHWFGPAGDPRCAGIGTPESIISVWSCHREIILDQGPIPSNWSIPPPS